MIILLYILHCMNTVYYYPSHYTCTEESDWSKISGEASWPSLPDSTIMQHDTLETVLRRLGLLDYYRLLQVS